MGKTGIKTKNRLDDIMHGDLGEYKYLFPYRKDIPKIKEHAFNDFNKSKSPADEYFVNKMLDPSMIGWTTKAILNVDLFAEQITILQTMWNHAFPMLIATRGGSKTFMLAIYSILKCLLEPGTKVVIVGAGLRQAKLVFAYIENVWNNAPILRNIVGGGKKAGPRQNVDLCYFKIGESIIYAIPLGDGSKVRGFRANVVLADEFASIPEDVFDIVVKGFATTSRSPVDDAKNVAIDKLLKELDIPDDVKESIKTDKVAGNQIVYSGTAYYEFNHFAKRHKMWCDIIRSRGDKQKVAKIFGNYTSIPDDFDYRDYAVIRLPYNKLPEGLLDKRQLAHDKATLPRNIFLMERCACFIKDSDGFYPRSLIESCTVLPDQPIPTPDGPAMFTPLMVGFRDRKYVMGIDPAAEVNKFAIVILEIWGNHFRVVHCWSVDKAEFNRRKKNNLVDEDDYYDYCCSKIRDFVRKFNPLRIEMDSQGGGYAISEMLRNKKLLDKEKKDFPIYEVIDYDNPKPTDSETDGRHILNLIQPTNVLNMEFNVAMHKSFETRRLLFPAFDVVKIQSSIMAEKAMNVIFDTYEECVNNIEELKNELCTIQRTETPTGKGKFDTPSIVTGIEGRQKKGRLQKDKYIALLYAHKYAYDQCTTINQDIDYNNVSGNFRKVPVKPGEGMYMGPGVGSMRNADGWMKTGQKFGAVKDGRRF